MRTQPRLRSTSSRLLPDPDRVKDLPEVAYDWLDGPGRMYVTRRVVEEGLSMEDALRLGREDHAAAVADGTAEPEHHAGHQPIVYYMRMDRLVKIGTTINITGRVAAIMPQGVLAVEFGGYDLEHERHRQFAADHSHGEWYWLREPLWTHVDQLRQGFPNLVGLSIETWLDQHRVRCSSLLDR